MIEKNKILEAYNFRHACKTFDPEKKIPQEDFDFLLETFRLSPSSFGMEPWRLMVITDDALKEKLKPHCWHQAQITTCSHLVVVIAKTAQVQDDAYITKMFDRRPLKEDEKLSYIKVFKTYIKDQVMGLIVKKMYSSAIKVKPVYEWASRQNYIATANMATSAAMIGIDSCFIEGFKKEEVEEILGIDNTMEDISVLLPLGYRVKEPKEKFRLAIDEIVTYK